MAMTPPPPGQAGPPPVPVTREAPPEIFAAGSYPPTGWADFRRRFVRNRLALVGLVMVATVVLAALLAPLLPLRDPDTQDLTRVLADPSSRHWMGTDELGRDLLSRVVHGARIAVVVGLATILLALAVGIVAGSLAGYLGGAWDSVIMRTADVFFAFPLTVGAVVVILVTGRGVGAVILALAVFSWAVPARLLRGTILAVREAEFVEAARSLGASRWWIVTRHVLPNSLGPVIVFGAVSVGGAIVAEAALSFLGVGVDPEVTEWGTMIEAGRDFFGYKNHVWLFPGLAVVYTVLGFVFVGDGLRDALDPRQR